MGSPHDKSARFSTAKRVQAPSGDAGVAGAATPSSKPTYVPAFPVLSLSQPVRGGDAVTLGCCWFA
jgi:hypothetical protein